MEGKKMVYNVRLSWEEKNALMEALTIARLDARGRKDTWISAAGHCEGEQLTLCKSLEENAARDYAKYDAMYGKLFDAIAEME